jgi:hypothetical protein
LEISERQFTAMAKYIVYRSDGTDIPFDEPCWVFRARDCLAAPAIATYRALAAAAGLPPAFIDDIDAHLKRIESWQAAHGSKLPD